MKKYFVFVAFLICNFSLFAQVNLDTIKTIDSYDEIVWEVKTPGQIYDVAYHPNGKFVFALDDKVIQMFNASDGSLIREMGRGLNYDFIDMDLSKSGKLVATCGFVSEIVIFDTETGQEKIRLKDTNGFYKPTEYRSVSFSPDGKKLVATAGNVDNSTSMVYLFDVETGAIISRLYNPRKPDQYEKEYKRYRKALFSNDGSYIILASEIRTLIIRCNTENLNPIDTLIDRGYSNFNYSENIVITIDNNQEYCFLNGFSNDGFLLNLYTKKIDSQRSAKFSATCLVFNKTNNKIIDSEGLSNLVSYDLTSNKPLYIYKTSSDYFSISSNDSLLISYTFQNLKLLKARWDSPTSVNNEPQISYNILSVFPNPVNNSLNAKISSQINGNIKLEILNINSQTLLTQNKNLIIGENNYTISTNSIPNGSYFLKATLNNNSKQINFIINK